MAVDPNRSEAERRVRNAVIKIETAYRLCDLNPQETLDAVRSAMIEGAKQHASDVEEDVRRAK